MAIVMLFSEILGTASAANVAASSDGESANIWSLYGTYSYTTGALWWKKTWNCRVYKNTRDFFLMFYTNAAQTSGFDYKGDKTHTITLSQTRSFTLSSQTTATLNSSIDVEAAGIKSGIGGSVSATTAKTWGVSNSSTVVIEKSAPAGYYAYCVCLDVMYLWIAGTKIGSVDIYAPKSAQPYRAVVYNADSANYTGALRY